jgi:DNA-binding transcriptional regulator PaaX
MVRLGMGKIELEAKKVRIHGRIQKAVLATLGVTGVLALGLVAPNAMKILRMFNIQKPRFGERIRRVATDLAARGLVVFVEKNRKKYLEITEKGKEMLAEIQDREELFRAKKKPKRWDKRWRLVVFDIPEHRRSVRNRLREMIVAFGFIKIQNSVWVYPYDCEELVTLLKSDLRIGREVLYAVVEKIENDKWLLRHFNLSG